MDFGTLKSRLLEVIGRAPADVCYEMVTADINQGLRLRVMESTSTVAEAATVTLPTDFLSLVSIYRDTNPRVSLEPLPPQTLHRVFETSGTPRWYAIEDGQIRLAPSPDGSENLVIRYYAALPDLSADTDTNDVLTRYPAVYVYGALVHHALLIQDTEKAQAWAVAYAKAQKQASADDRRYRGGSKPVVPIARATA